MANFYLNEYNKVNDTWYGDLQQYVIAMKSHWIRRGDVFDEMIKAIKDCERVMVNIQCWHSTALPEYEEVKRLRDAIIKLHKEKYK